MNKMEQKIFTIKGLKYLTTSFFTLILYILLNNIFFLYSYATNVIMPYQIIYLLMFISIITFFIGTFYIWKGRNEITEKHINNVDKGLWLIIIFLAITVIFGLFLDKTITNSLSFFILNLMIMLASFYFLKDISSNKIGVMIWIAVFLFVFFNPLITIVMYYFQNDYYIYLYRLVLQILSLAIPYLLFTVCYYKTYKTIKKNSKG